MRVYCIDVLKAIAIFAVVLYHSGFMPFGYLGVDLFLVVSGYMTIRSLLRKHLLYNSLGGGGIIRHYFDFEISRIIRLLPTLLIACIVSMAIGYVIMIDDTYESLSQSVVATSFFGNNVVEMIATGDYWAQDKAFSPLMHTWYVGLVMQFYLLIPLLFYFAKLDKQNPQRTLLSLISILGVISLLIYFGDTNSARRFYLLPSRFVEFAAGGLVAMLYKPDKGTPYNKIFIWVCYILLLISFMVKDDIIPTRIRLVLVMALSCILLCSQNALENKITANSFLAKIGSASYSIFVWHQVVLAYYRSIYGGHFTPLTYSFVIVLVALMSWLSYHFIEQGTNRMLMSKKGKIYIWSITILVFVVLNIYTLHVYKNAGVVRDIPELEVNKANPQRGMWAEYNGRIFDNDKPFETENKHWLVIGNSFARDFANIVYESDFADKIEVSYIDQPDYMDVGNEVRFRNADKIFVASKDYTREFVHNIELLAMAFGHSLEDVIVVGEKYFGETMTQVYSRRFKDDYLQTEILLTPKLIEKNNVDRNKYGERFIDLISIVQVNDEKVRAFTEDGMFISSDCVHLTRAGAEYFAQHIEWNQYFNN